MVFATPRPAVIWAFALIYVVWGSTYLAVALALRSIPPFLLMGSRSILGGCVLLLAAWAIGQEIRAWMWARAAACGVFLFVGCHGTMAYAQQRVPSSITAVLLATIPFWIAVINALVPSGEKTTIKQLGLLVPGFAGVALIVLCQSEVRFSATVQAGFILLIGAAVAWAIGTVLSERWSSRASVVAFSGTELIAGGVVLLCISMALDEPNRFHPQAMSAEAVGGWIYLTLAGTVIAFGAYIWLLTQVSTTLVATYTFVNPVIAVLLGWAVLGERPNRATALGAILVMASVIGLLVARHGKHPARTCLKKH
jgi:drug/metabolite transporter (DMT)-like permease